VEETYDLTAARRAKRGWLALALAIAAVLFVLDAVTSQKANLIGLFAVPPFVAAVGAGRRETAGVAALAVAMALISGVLDDFFGSFDHLSKVVLVAAASVFAIRVAEVRERAEVASRLEGAVARILAETRGLADASPRILEGIGRTLGWDAASLWEVRGGRDTLHCTATWQDPDARLEQFQEFNRELHFGPGVGLPGRVLASGEPAWVTDVSKDANFPRGTAAKAVGIRTATSFPIVGDRGTRGVVDLFSRRSRRPDKPLLRAMASTGRYIGQHLDRRRVEEAVRRAEELRGAVLESALDCVITMNHEGRVVEFNQAAESTFGYRRADAVGKKVGDLIVPPALRQQHRHGLERYLSSGESKVLGQRLELTGMRSDRSEFPVEVSIVRIGADDPPMFAGYLRDLSASRLAEQSSRRLAAIVEYSNDAIIGVDVEGRILSWNPGAERLYGYSSEEALGQPITITTPPELGDEALLLMRTAVEGHQVNGHRTVRRRKDGSMVDVAVTLSPILDGEGEIVGFAGIVREITEEVETERERLRLLEQETKARRRAEELERGASFLVEIHTTLDSSLDYEVVLERLARITVPRLADWCVIHVLEGDAVRQIAAAHTDPEGERLAWELEERYPPDPDDPQGVPAVLRTGEPQLLTRITDEMIESGARDPGHLEILRGLQLRSAMLVPLRARGQTLGAITLVSAESGRIFEQEDLDFASAVARRAALSIDNARLHGEVIERGEEMEFLAGASAELDAALDLDETLQKLADLTVPHLGDGCMVDLLDETGEISRVASATKDPAARTVLESLQEETIELDSPHPVAKAIKTGQLQRLESIDEAMRRTWTSDESYLAAVRDWPGQAAVVAPMRARGRLLGAIAVASFTKQRFDDDDVRVIRELARRASIAVDNARLYGESKYIASRLQQSLLPPHLPEIPGAEIAARFRPAGESNDVGGDFYDIFQRGPDQWAITIGDVCGKGPDAAAVTSLARHTLRATALRGDDSPDDLLKTLNRAMLTEGPLAYQFCTVAFASFLIGSSTRVAVASGGHPLPIVMRTDGTVEAVGAAGTLLGVVDDPEITCTDVELSPGDTMVFYTDGITEARTNRGMLGLDGLLSALRSCVGCAAAEVAERIEQRLESETVELRDDVALVVFQVAHNGGGRIERATALTAKS
jgi:PAS domain S-box-containing protein